MSAIQGQREQITVRPATEADLLGLRNVAQRTWYATYTGLIPAADIAQFLESNYSQVSLGRTLRALGSGMLVATHGGQVIGYATAG